MATRLYATPSAAAPISVAVSSFWDGGLVTFVSRPLSVSKTSAADEYNSSSNSDGSANYDALNFQLVSAPIAAGPLGGTFTGQFFARDVVGAGANMTGQVVVRVVSNTGSTVRGTLYAGDLSGTSSSVWASDNWYNRRFPSTPSSVNLTPVTAQVNDRVVVEIGWRALVGVVTAGTVVISDSAAVGDLPAGAGTANSVGPPTLATWVEFSDSLFTTRVAPIVRTWIME